MTARPAVWDTRDRMRLLVAAWLGAALTAPVADPASGPPPGSPEAEVGRQAQRLWRAVATCDVAGLLDFVPSEGLLCGDRFFRRDDLKRQLEDRQGEMRT